jgi:hypothetical protein
VSVRVGEGVNVCEEMVAGQISVFARKARLI